MYTLSKNSIRVRNKSKGKRKRTKKVNFRNSGEESSYEYIGLSSNNLPNIPKKPDHRPPQYKFCEKQNFQAFGRLF